MPLSDNTRGSLLMAASMAGFAINDAFMKLNFEAVPVAQTIFVRGLFASAFLIALAWWTGALSYRPSRKDWRPLALRTFGEMAATASFMMALSHMPIANATAVLQAAPLAVTMAAALFLHEKVGWRRWSAIAVGFVGMLIIVQPGTSEFDAFALYAVIAVVFITLRDLSTRQMSRETPTVFASVVSAIFITLGAGVVSPLEGWAPMDLRAVGLTLAAAACIIVGYVSNVASMRVGEVGAVAPFRYTVLIWALVLGYLFFGDVPDWATVAGAGIVTAAGLYTLWREQVVGRSRSAATAPVRPFDGTRPGATTPPAARDAR